MNRTMVTGPTAAGEMAEAYRRWRASRLGRITDKIERDLILELCGNPAGLQVLDVGCGDGDLAVALFRRGANVTGLDADPRMLAAAERRLRDEHASATLVEGDIHALPFADSSFDVVTAVAVLCLVPDAQSAVRAMARVLKPGGRLVLGELGRCSVWAAVRRVRGWLGSPTWNAARFWSASELRRLTEGSGLSVAEVRGAVFYPPLGWLAAATASIDPWLGGQTTCGAAFIAVGAVKAR